MDSFIRKSNWLRPFLVGGVIGGIVLATAIIIGLITNNFTNYQNNTGIPQSETPPSQVAFGNIHNGIQLEANESLMVNATAVGPDNFLSMELWINGELVGVQAAPSGGVHPFLTFFYWLPNQTGNHSLIAAAVNSTGQRTFSEQIVVIVNQELNAVGFITVTNVFSPTVLPASGNGGFISPKPPGPGASVRPAENWSGSPGDWINSLIAAEKPAAPELMIRSAGCGAELLIHDLSDNEEGFLVYREDSYSPNWVQVAALSANSESDWISFADGGLPGMAAYYVSAFNGQGETDSNLATVNINPADCPPESGKIPGYALEITKLFPELPTEMSYCYQSTDGVNWTRWPQLGFLKPDEDGIVSGGPVLQIQNQGIGGGEDMTPKLGVNMECWGWQSGVLVQLGDFFVEVEDMDPEYFDPSLVGDPGLQAEVVFHPVEFVGQPSYPQVIGEIVPGQADQPEISESSDFNAKDSQNQLKTSISPLMPNLWLDSTVDINDCMKHLPPHLQNSQGASTHCFVYPKFDPNQGTGVVQPYLIWGLNSPRACLGGTGEDCMSYAELQVLAEQSGGVVGFDLRSVSNAGTFTWPISEPNLTMFVMPPLSCTGSADYVVRMWYKPGPKGVDIDSAGPGVQVDVDGSDFSQADQLEVQEGAISSEDQPEIPVESSDISVDSGPHPTMGEVYYSMPSNVETLPCVPIVAVATPIQYLDITYDKISLFNISDGEFTDCWSCNVTVELYGYFRVEAPSMGQEKTRPCFSLFGCESETETWLAYTRRYLNVGVWDEDFKNGVVSKAYNLSGWELCQSTSKKSCKFEGQPTSHSKNNNTIRVFVKDGDALTLEVHLIDHDPDTDSADDKICVTATLTIGHDIQTWSTFQNETFELKSKDDGSGFCIVEGVINAVDP